MSAHRRTFGPIPLLALLALATIAAACGPRTGELGTVAPPPSDSPQIDIPTPEPTPGGSPSTQTPAPGTPGPSPSDPGTMTLRVYFFLGSFTDNAGLVPVLRELPRTPAVGAAAMQALLRGPNEAELGARPAMYTTIPVDTRFLGLRIEDRIAIVNLSREFEQGGGTASVLGRLAQVVYTLTQFPTVDGVRFELDGEPVTVFSGQGVVLDEPVGRNDYTDQLPAIFVDRPAWGAVLANPARIVGLADVFEATFRARILDAAGRVLAEGNVMASCGTGCWGTFDETIPYNVTAGGRGTLQVYSLSAADGSQQNLTEYPVWLTP
ncbi:MAG TPA: Gmad2 immunoglobulin-like domain-containing protein [Candidatus Binatia bacterium]|nr:Gmad2 immunoglobulin-like domain-containing protein [Candidatus Binatia bacterium]